MMSLARVLRWLGGWLTRGAFRVGRMSASGRRCRHSPFCDGFGQFCDAWEECGL
jgi:hypothetical protein